MSIDIKQKIQSINFRTIEAVIEYQANKQLTLNEPQNMCDDDAATRWVFSPKFKEGDKLEKEYCLSELVEKRYAELYFETYGRPIPEVSRTETELRNLVSELEAKAAEYDRIAERAKNNESWARNGGKGTGFSTAALMLLQFINNHDFSQTSTGEPIDRISPLPAVPVNEWILANDYFPIDSLGVWITVFDGSETETIKGYYIDNEGWFTQLNDPIVNPHRVLAWQKINIPEPFNLPEILEEKL